MKELEELLGKCARNGPTFFQLTYFVVGKEPTNQAKMHKCLEEIKLRLKSIDSVRLQIEEANDQNTLYELEIKKLPEWMIAEEHSIRVRQIRRKIVLNEQHLNALQENTITWQEEIKFLKNLYDQIAEHVELKPWDDYDVQLEYWNAKMAQEIHERLILNTPVDIEVIRTALALPEQAPIRQQLLEYVETKEKQLTNT